MSGKSPSFVMKSLWQIPQACTRIRTCPAPGFGISRSTISKSAPGLGTCATFIFAIETLRSSFWICAQHLDARLLKTDTSRGAADERTKEKFCNDFRSDAQAVQLTRMVLPRTMRHRFEQESFHSGKENFRACPPARNVVQKRRKGEHIADLSCLLTQLSKSPCRTIWMLSAPCLARSFWITMR